MLQTQTVDGTTLGLLKALLAMPELTHFSLVGGTNLSLRLGHRLSIDLDLFTNEPFDTEGVARALITRFPSTIIASQSEKTMFAYINDVKIDMVLLPYPYIEPVEYYDGIRLVSLPDIMAMKMSAIARRGVKKDFWDIAELLDMYSLAEMIGFYKMKYKSHDILHLVRSLAYFTDAEKQKENPVSLKKATWKQVKNKMETAVKKYLERNKI